MSNTETDKLEELLNSEFDSEFDDNTAPETEDDSEVSDDVDAATEESLTTSDENFHADQIQFDFNEDQ